VVEQRSPHRWKKILPLVRRANNNRSLDGSHVAIAAYLQAPTRSHVAASVIPIFSSQGNLAVPEILQGTEWVGAMAKRSVELVGLAVCLLACLVPISALPAGGIGGGGRGGPVRITPRLGGAPSAGNALSMAPVFDRPQRIRNRLNVTGLIGISEKNPISNGPIVQLDLGGRDIPMRLDTQLDGVELQFDLNENYARDLYESILTKRIEVVGPQELRDQIEQAADQWKPLEIQGYIFGRATPFLVVKAAGPE
jgi:hypothetical protein